MRIIPMITLKTNDSALTFLAVARALTIEGRRARVTNLQDKAIAAIASLLAIFRLN
jgi:hypothetical protein